MFTSIYAKSFSLTSLTERSEQFVNFNKSHQLDVLKLLVSLFFSTLDANGVWRVSVCKRITGPDAFIYRILFRGKEQAHGHMHTLFLTTKLVNNTIWNVCCFIKMLAVVTNNHK